MLSSLILFWAEEERRAKGEKMVGVLGEKRNGKERNGNNESGRQRPNQIVKQQATATLELSTSKIFINLAVNMVIYVYTQSASSRRGPNTNEDIFCYEGYIYI